MNSPVLKLPAYKVFLNQIKNAKKISDSENQLINEWTLVFTCKPYLSDKDVSVNVNVSNIWIQGTVVSVQDDSVIIDDGTGLAWITGLVKLPQSSSNIQVNSCVMILGHILSTEHTSLKVTNHNLPEDNVLCAKLKAIKVTDISENPNCRSGEWWKKEVSDAQTHVLLSMCLRNNELV